MAITINTNPQSMSSVQDDLWHVVTSDNSGTTDFKYVFDVWVNGVQKIRVKKFPEPSNGKGYFNAGPTVRNEMSYDWFAPDPELFVVEPDLSGQVGISYVLRVGEEVSGVTTANLASGTTTAYNWAPNLFKRRAIGLSDKVNKWLTNRPLYANAEIGENLFIPFYSSGGIYVNIETFDHSNQSIDQVRTILRTGDFYQLNIGSTAINTEVTITIDSTVKYYDVWVDDGVTDYDKFRVYLTCNPKYTPIPVHFLNRWGMYDTQRFDLASRLQMDVKRSGFERKDYSFVGTSVNYTTNSIYNEGKINYSQAAEWTYKLNADAMTDAEWEWISDLIVSPQIIMEIDGSYYPVTIKNTNYEYSKFVNDKLKALEIEFEFNTTRYSQLR